MKHILRAVDEQLALNAVREPKKSLGDKLTPQARLLVDMAKAGACGQPPADRQKLARLVLEVGQFGDDAAVAEALVELSKHLDLAEDSRDSHELCARAVGEAWRRHAPFRVSRAGDPLDVLFPHLTPAEAVLALDRARTLPPAPATALVRRTYELDRPPSAFSVPYSRNLALALLGEAEAAYKDFVSVQPSDCGSDQYAVDDNVEKLARLLTELRAWIESEPSALDTGIDAWSFRRLAEVVDKCSVLLGDRTAYAAALRLRNAGHRLHGYIVDHEQRLSDLEERVANGDSGAVEAKHRHFPDFYPTEEDA